MSSLVSKKLHGALKENVHHTGKHTSKSAERKSLMTLQLSATGKLIGTPVGPSKKPANKIPFSREPVKIYHDKKPSPPVETGTQTEVFAGHEEGTQTDVTVAAGIQRLVAADEHNDSGVGSGDFDQEAYDLMVKEPVPETYWRDLAEERRLSLAEALAENEQLHQSMEEMKEDMHSLSLLASQAESLASMLNSVLDEETDTDQQKKSEVEANTNEADNQPKKTENEDDSCEEKEANNSKDDDQSKDATETAPDSLTE